MLRLHLAVKITPSVEGVKGGATMNRLRVAFRTVCGTLRLAAATTSTAATATSATAAATACIAAS
jgi:hypothetical protein